MQPDAASHPLRPRILVVDDQLDAADSLAHLLELCGAKAAVAYGAETGLRLMQLFRPAAAVIDLRMPGKDGCEALLEARRCELVHPATLLVCCTGSHDPDDEARCRAAGFDLFLHKPIEPGELASLVEWATQRMQAIDFMETPPETGFEVHARTL
jgi:CheY-like chemotaxis protein